MTDRIHFKKFYPNYYSFLVNGAMVLLVGAILPYLMEESGINYSTAGLFLSAFAIGNFLASFVNPFLTKVVGRKASIVITSCLMPLSLMGISLIPPVPVIILLFVLLGISRGSYSIINNAYINEKGDGSAAALNLLHMVFAIGAFLAPMILSFYFKIGLSWRSIVYTISIASTISIIMVFMLDLSGNGEKKRAGHDSENVPSQKKKFWKEPVFFVSGFLLFFYLGLENCVNGWFVTYFKNTGIMSITFANSLVSFTWLAVLFGRLATAIVSTKVKQKHIILADCFAAAIFFTLLISTKNLAVITISIIALGFFFAGIYPTGVSNAGSVIKGSDLGTSMLLAISALGGILTPQIVGSVADRIGLIGAIALLLVNMVAMIVLALVNMKVKKD
ncbi:MAG: MFS transporter [Treponema sp.]|jgi:fucose permease|nr:MFS transporter [Treponema sp.]